MSLELQINEKFVKANTELQLGGGGVMSVTPPLSGEYWVLRVPLSETQAVVCFPKFFTFGIGFQREEDWNTNLPYTSDAREIFEHIAHNKGDDSIPDERCVEAIRMLQGAIAEIDAKVKAAPTN